MEWREPAAELCRLIGDLDEPAYLVSTADAVTIDPRLRVGRYQGWTSTIADLLFRDWLIEQGKWQGRGFAAVIDSTKATTLQEFLGTVLHELAHYLTFANLPEDSAENREVARLYLKSMPDKLADPNCNPEDPFLPDRYFHGQEFIRAACHVAHRANKEIGSVRPKHLRFSTPYYGLYYSENTMMSLLESELESKKPIREILKTEPPKRFVEILEMATEKK